jgi:flavin reductase (DIM6/NTAB) family NADH-FMN oxidoreductase RutF
MMQLAESLKTAMRQLPSGVAIVTARDPKSGMPSGLAASSVISVTLDPPTMLVAVNRSGASHATIAESGYFCINLLEQRHRELVSQFSLPERREERFIGDDWATLHDLDYLKNTTALFCRTFYSMVVGTHELFLGEVFDIALTADPDPMGWMNGGFHDVVPSQWGTNDD